MIVLALSTSSVNDEVDETKDDDVMIVAASARPSLGLDCLDTAASWRTAWRTGSASTLPREDFTMLDRFLEIAIPRAARALHDAGQLSEDGRNNLSGTQRAAGYAYDHAAPSEFNSGLVTEIAHEDPDQTVRSLAWAALYARRAGLEQAAARELFRAYPAARDWLRAEAAMLIAVSYDGFF